MHFFPVIKSRRCKWLWCRWPWWNWSWYNWSWYNWSWYNWPWYNWSWYNWSWCCCCYVLFVSLWWPDSLLWAQHVFFRWCARLYVELYWGNRHVYHHTYILKLLTLMIICCSIFLSTLHQLFPCKVVIIPYYMINLLISHTRG